MSDTAERITARASWHGKAKTSPTQPSSNRATSKQMGLPVSGKCFLHAVSLLLSPLPLFPSPPLAPLPPLHCSHSPPLPLYLSASSPSPSPSPSPSLARM